MSTSFLCVALLIAEPAPNDAQPLASLVADLSAKEQRVQLAARDALVKRGPQAKSVVPALVALVGDKETPWTLTRNYAIDVLGAIGPDAKMAVPQLNSLLDAKLQPYALESVVVALGNIAGPTKDLTSRLLHVVAKGRGIMLTDSPYLRTHQRAVAEHLLELCDAANQRTSDDALRVLAGTEYSFDSDMRIVLAKVVDDVRAKMPALLDKHLKSPSPYHRIIAAEACTTLYPDQAKKVLPIVIATMIDEKSELGIIPCDRIFAPIPNEAAAALVPLFDGTEHARLWAIATLSRMNVHEHLATTLQSAKSERIRSGAALTMSQRNYDRTRAVAALTGALKDAAATVRMQAVEGLVLKANRGDDALDQTIPILEAALTHESAATRRWAAEHLGRVGSRALAVVAALKKCAADMNPDVARAATLTLVAIAPAEAVVGLPTLQKALADADEQQVRPLINALGAIGPKAKAALPALQKYVESKYHLTRIAAACAIGRIDSEQGPAMAKVILACYTEQRANAGSAALQALGQLGSSASVAVPVLVHDFEQMRASNKNVDVDVLVALHTIAPERAKPHLEWARAAVRNPKSDVGQSMVYDMPECRGAAKLFVTELMELLDRKEPSMQRAAAVALSNVGRDASAALPKLKMLSEKSPQAVVRREATMAAKLIEKGITYRVGNEHD